MATSATPDHGRPARDGPTLRMGDLTRESGLSRQAIHFYMAEGLLPPPVSAGRNAATYGEEHLARLNLIQKLQREHFLSLNAIKAVLNGENIDAFSAPQKQLLRRLRDELPGWARPLGRPETPLAALLGARLDEGDVLGLAAAGLIDIHGEGAERTVSEDDREILDCLARYREAGATRARGYRPEHLASIDQAIERLVRQLAQVYASNWQNAPADEAAAFVEAVLPIDERLILVLLRKKIRELIETTLETGGETPRP